MKYFRGPSFMLVAIPKAMSSVFGNRGLVISAKTSGCKMVSRRNIEIPGPTVSTSTDLGASSAMKVRETVENPASLQSAHMVVQQDRSEEHTSELQSLMRISYAVCCLKKKTISHKSTPKVMNKVRENNKKE